MDRFSRDGLTFDVRDGGPPDGEVIVLLHGFPQTSACWDEVAAGPHAAGFRTLAPDQRGYSPGARPKGRRAYVLAELAGDVVALLDAAGVERAHVVGHDWGGGVAWATAALYPDRLRSVTAVSAPHPAAMRRAMATSTQLLRSWYMFFIQLPRLPELAIGSNPDRFRKGLVRGGVPEDKAKVYVDKLTEPGALTAALNYYRAAVFGPPVGRVRVRTLFVWSTGDRFLAPAAAARTADYVDGPYRAERLDGDHWIPDNQPDRLVELLLGHVREA